MSYFGGGGIPNEGMHPSLRTYIDCFMSSPMPKGFPRGGGFWDQDPILMRDFRLIKAQEVLWKQTNEQMSRQKQQLQSGQHQPESEGGAGLGNSLEDFIQQLEEEDSF